MFKLYLSAALSLQKGNAASKQTFNKAGLLFLLVHGNCIRKKCSHKKLDNQLTDSKLLLKLASYPLKN